MAPARDRLRSGRRSLELRPRRVDRGATAGPQHSAALAKHADRIVEEEEDDRHRDGGERIVLERQALGLPEHDLCTGRVTPRELHHLLTMVEPRDRKSTRPNSSN